MSDLPGAKRAARPSVVTDPGASSDQPPALPAKRSKWPFISPARGLWSSPAP